MPVGGYDLAWCSHFLCQQYATIEGDVVRGVNRGN